MDLLPEDKPVYWFARHDGILHTGVTYPGQVTSSGMDTFISGNLDEISASLLVYADELTSSKLEAEISRCENLLEESTPEDVDILSEKIASAKNQLSILTDFRVLDGKLYFQEAGIICES